MLFRNLCKNAVMKINYLDIVRQSSIKLTRVAEKMGMSESHLRYHLGQENINAGIEARFLKVMRKTLKDVDTILKKKSSAKKKVIETQTVVSN